MANLGSHPVTLAASSARRCELIRCFELISLDGIDATLIPERAQSSWWWSTCAPSTLLACQQRLQILRSSLGPLRRLALLWPLPRRGRRQRTAPAPEPGSALPAGVAGPPQGPRLRPRYPDEEIIEALDDGILWTTVGETPDLAGALAKLHSGLTGERPAFKAAEDPATSLAKRLEGKNCLVVIDDVWDSAQLEPFLRGGGGKRSHHQALGSGQRRT